MLFVRIRKKYIFAIIVLIYYKAHFFALCTQKYHTERIILKKNELQNDE